MTATLPECDAGLSLRKRALEAENASLREIIRLCLIYVEAYRPIHIANPPCDRPECIVCGPTRAWHKALAAARAVVGEMS